MKVKAQDLIDLIVGKNAPGFVGIIREYRQLKFKLQNSSRQSWYFQKGMDANKQRLVTLTKHFEAYREQLKRNSLDDLITAVNQTYDEEKKVYKRDHLGLIGHLCLGSIYSRRNRLNELIALKSRVEELMPIDYYAEHPEVMGE